jgi:hypothetical protein
MLVLSRRTFPEIDLSLWKSLFQGLDQVHELAQKVERIA